MAGVLVGRPPRQSVLFDGIRIQRHAICRNDESNGHRAAHFIVDGDNAGLFDGRMAFQQLLDFDRKDVLAVAHEHVVDTVGKIVKTIRVAAQDIAGL